MLINKGSFALIEPAVHDGKLTGITVRGNDEVHLSVTTIGGNDYLMVLTGVVGLRADRYLLVNVILDVAIVPIREVNNDVLRELFEIEKGSVDEAERIGKIRSNAERLNLKVLELNPSDGCALLALFSEIRCESVTH